jgi:hypothetical protein
MNNDAKDRECIALVSIRARAARVCGLGAARTLVQTCAVPHRPEPESATRTFAELLIDREEERMLHAVLVGMRGRAAARVRPGDTTQPDRCMGLPASWTYSRLMWFSWIEDPTTTRRPPTREPNWRKVILVLVATAIVLTLALAIGAVIR